MPALDVQNAVVSAISEVRTLLDQLLAEAEAIKPIQTTTKASANIEPALHGTDFDDISGRITTASSAGFIASSADGEDASKEDRRSRQFQVVEVAAREVFGELVSSAPIDSPAFVKVWNFLDLLSILTDTNQCDSALLLYLVEELLDSQTIAGCRIIFDWLESRRHRITPENPRKTDGQQKAEGLVLLRICNELLRRLSRAEDNVFCGRVFIFVFQCVPLGDRSSVNLHGGYHVENVTTYESNTAEDDSKMDIDSAADTQKENGVSKPATNGNDKKTSEPLSSDALYYLFWPLQESFSQPLQLFEPQNLQKFKHSVEVTVKKFESFPASDGPRALSNTHKESTQGLKRKRGEDDEFDGLETFNPKYLTSKDLFELEVNDLTFRRHILVQMLITLNFILSWTADAKKRYEPLYANNKGNKGVLYSTEFSEEDAKWAKTLKTRIADYMKKDQPGKIFHRMVDTVLSRDKNWVYWKMATCPPIKREPVQPQLYAEAKASAQKLATSKRLRSVPMNAVPLDFLQPADENGDGVKDLKRYELPELESFKSGIADDEFEISMPTSDQTKARAVAGKASKSWRALRVASRSRLAAFDKIDDSNTISIVFEEPKDDEMDVDEEAPVAEDDIPENKDPIVISGPPSVGKSSIVEKLLEAKKGVFAKVVRHTTRQPADGEVDGKDFHFVKKPEFSQLRDGDRLVEYTDEGEVSYGTSTKAIDAVTEKDKIPIIELGIEAAQFAKDMDFSARYILIKPPSPESLQSRLEAAGITDAEKIKAIVDELPEQLDESKTGELFDTIVVNEDLEQSCQGLVDYLYAKGTAAEAEEKDEEKEEEAEEEEAEDEEAEDEEAEEKEEEEDKDAMEA